MGDKSVLGQGVAAVDNYGVVRGSYICVLYFTLLMLRGRVPYTFAVFECVGD